MPKIPEYFNTENLTPTDRGANAWENAARRIPSFYNSAASNERATGRQTGALFDKEASNAREGGQIDARAFKQKLWPFDMQELYDRRALRSAQATAEAASNAPRNPSFRVVGDISPLETAERRAARANAGGYGGGGAAVQQMAAGAGAVGNMMRDGGQRASRRDPAERQETKGGSGQYTIQNGEFITMSEARKGMMEFNAQRDEAGWKNLNSAIDTQNYWDRYYGDTGTVQSGWRGEGAGTISQQGWFSDSEVLTPGYSTNRGVPTPPPIPAIDDASAPNILERAWNATEFSEVPAAWRRASPAASAPIPRE